MNVVHKSQKHTWVRALCRLRDGSGQAAMPILAITGASLVLITTMFSDMRATFAKHALERDLEQIQDFHEYITQKLGVAEICGKNFAGDVLTAATTLAKTELKETYDTPFLQAGVSVPDTNGRIHVNLIELEDFVPLQASGPDLHRGYANLVIGYQGQSGSGSKTMKSRVFVITNDGSSVPADANKILSCSTVVSSALPACQDGDTLVYVAGTPICASSSGAQLTTAREFFTLPCNAIPTPASWIDFNPEGEACATVVTSVLAAESAVPFAPTSGVQIWETVYTPKANSKLFIRTRIPISWRSARQEGSFMLAAWAISGGTEQLLGLDELANPNCATNPLYQAAAPSTDYMWSGCPNVQSVMAKSAFTVDVTKGLPVTIRLNMVIFDDLQSAGDPTQIRVGTLRYLDTKMDGTVEFEEVTRP